MKEVYGIAFVQSETCFKFGPGERAWPLWKCRLHSFAEAAWEVLLLAILLFALQLPFIVRMVLR